MALRSEKRFRDICDWLAFPVVTLRPDKGIIGANNHFLERYGFTEESVSQKKCYQIFFGSDEPCPGTECIMHTLLREKTTASRTKETIGSDGSPYYEEIKCLPIQDDDGEVKLIVATITDITRSKLIEADLKKTKEFLENIIYSSVRAIVAADMKGRVLLMNESAKKLFGYTDKEIAGRLFATDGYTPEMAKEIMDKLRSPDHGGIGKLDSIEMEVIDSSSTRIPVEMSASIVYENGTEIATMAMFRDLRPKLADEEKWEKTMMQLMQSEKLASLGRLAAGVAHEINNPLGGIIMYSHLALEDLPEDSPSFGNLRKVVSQAERCKNIVKGLLDFSRQGEPKFENVNVNDIIEEILSLVETHALFQNIRIIKELDPDLPPITGDKSQLQQVFMNLAVNAAEAMEDGGKLIVKSSGGKVSVVIEFTDTGCGIRPEDREKLFEPFFTTKSVREGTGLGLAVSHGIITRHDGTISFESRVNEGTTFRVKLPVAV